MSYVTTSAKSIVLTAAIAVSSAFAFPAFASSFDAPRVEFSAAAEHGIDDRNSSPLGEGVEGWVWD
ncbi:hypothetical protein [Streptomyces turgidiscabies]|uniref:Uncharacterized protein n=1 Tax=Streptomyces turgidiscabies TaxID=85558 RepID=A0ABU0RFT8_9ACTN|nr:hypothetical protein [Streptomyces turgidiscabies]MDQ0930859.1 hypothetical protein [Streptomyces turgidiscabies]